MRDFGSRKSTIITENGNPAVINIKRLMKLGELRIARRLHDRRRHVKIIEHPEGHRISPCLRAIHLEMCVGQCLDEYEDANKNAGRRLNAEGFCPRKDHCRHQPAKKNSRQTNPDQDGWHDRVMQQNDLDGVARDNCIKQGAIDEIGNPAGKNDHQNRQAASEIDPCTAVNGQILQLRQIHGEKRA